ncbi:unnamed protein product [Candidula unifasciata]|uniref:Guanine nucleotide-binding protein G(s) subunit alpha n=1 Tax=Candidula unifasciata TaxID=100452 RepID=A0A8S3YPG2_9EUPU|nr:unnamed protein product [Candidula unifasciata]
MQDAVMACFSGCVPEREAASLYDSPEEAKQARQRDKELTKVLNKEHKEDMRRIKLLLLGTGESGKSTITKQLKIIHVNGYCLKERLEKISDIVRNVRESMLAILVAMQQLSINLQKESNKASAEFLLAEAAEHKVEASEEFWDHCEKLWADQGVQACFMRSHEYQLFDCAKYFLDKISQLRDPSYAPPDQDILRCRAITTSIQHIEFDVPDAGQQVRFSLYDVGGQRGERKKWIQVFDSVVAILYLGDTSSFDQTLREDPRRNRLIESLEIFQQVWNNRFLRPVSILLFLNKIDILADKIARGRSITDFLAQYPNRFPEYSTFSPTANEKSEFLEAFPCGHNAASKKRGRLSSRPDINPEVTKTAVYIKHLYMKIVTGELSVGSGVQGHDRTWHQNHSCEYFYTCAVDTNNVKIVLEGCRTLIIRKHLERFGII